MWKCPRFSTINCSQTITNCRFLRGTARRNFYETHYEVLNLPRNCSDKDIRNAFIKLSKQYHPDRNKDKESQARFVKISNAYSVLSKPQLRREYDLGLPPPGYSSAQHTNYAYRQNHVAKHPWDDPLFYRNRDRSKDYQYWNRPYYGIQGINRVPNSVIGMLCILIAVIGTTLQMLAIRHSFTLRRDEMQRQSKEAAENLANIRKEADENGNELQIKLLEQKFKESGIYK